MINSHQGTQSLFNTPAPYRAGSLDCQPPAPPCHAGREMLEISALDDSLPFMPSLCEELEDPSNLLHGVSFPSFRRSNSRDIILSLRDEYNTILTQACSNRSLFQEQAEKDEQAGSYRPLFTLGDKANIDRNESSGEHPLEKKRGTEAVHQSAVFPKPPKMMRLRQMTKSNPAA